MRKSADDAVLAGAAWSQNVLRVTPAVWLVPELRAEALKVESLVELSWI